MSNRKSFIVVIFIGGMLAGMAGLGVIYTQKKLVDKIFGKLEGYRLAFVPKKTEAMVLCDFENEREMGVWQENAAQVFLSDEHVVSGKSSGKIVFATGEDPGIKIKKLFERNRGLANWEGYDSFHMDIYNPNENPLTVQLKFKDRKGRNYTDKIYLAPKLPTDITISLAQMRRSISPGRIAQISLFFWKPPKSRTLFIDNVRLLPARFTDQKSLVILDSQYLPKEDEPSYKIEYFDFAAKKEKWLQKGWVWAPLYVNNPTGAMVAGFPVSGGVPLPKGEVTSLDQLMVLDAKKVPVPFQARTLGIWPDKSLKWVQIRSTADMLPLQRQSLYLGYGPAREKIPDGSTPLAVQDYRGVEVTTGPLKFFTGKEGFRLFDKVWLDTNDDGNFSEQEVISAGSDLGIIFHGEEYRSSLDKDYSLTLEENGPVAASLKAEGWFVSKKGKKFCRFITRVQAFKNEDFVHVSHTFIFTGYPANEYHYLYKGKRLPANEMIEAVFIETPYRLDGGLEYSFGADKNSFRTQLTSDVQIAQTASRNFKISANNKTALTGERLEGWLDVTGPENGLGIVVKNCWQQFPKGWEIVSKDNVVRTYLWPSWEKPLDLQTTALAYGEDAVARGSAFGLAKTHDLAFYFHKGTFDKETGWNTVKLLSKTILLSASPEWVYDTSAAGKLVPLNQRDFAKAEETAALMFDWAQRQVKDFDWYGMIDFGDTLSWFRDGSWNPNGRWGWMNVEAMGLHPGCLMQYLRTGDYKYFEYGENSTRHVMDVDMVHYNTIANDPRLKNVIDEAYSQVGSMHRHNADHWGGRNEETSHTNLHGILLYYYMTGYERAFDVAKEIGEFFLKERVTYFRHPDICPQRSISNLLWGVIEMYEVTGDERYKKTADKWADILFRGQRYDGMWGQEYNPLLARWDEKNGDGFALDYTLPAFVAYHQITGNKAIGDSIVRATKYFVTNKPYNPFYEALVYSYYLTGDTQFLKTLNERVGYHVGHQRKNTIPIEQGMIYQKPYYSRAVEFLYQLPFAFEGLAITQMQSRSLPGAGLPVAAKSQPTLGGEEKRD